MSTVEYLKQFVSGKLAAAAEEIFAVFHNAIAEYEEELDRHRKLLQLAWKPVVKLDRIGSQHLHLTGCLVHTVCQWVVLTANMGQTSLKTTDSLQGQVFSGASASYHNAIHSWVYKPRTPTFG